MSLTRQYFTSNDTWVCPAGITDIILIGCGGGGGGSGSDGTNPGSGGGGAMQSATYAQVTPGSSYAVVIGAGGAGGSGLQYVIAGDPIPNPTLLPDCMDGYSGSNTTFGTIASFKGAGGAGGPSGGMGGTMGAKGRSNAQMVNPVTGVFYYNMANQGGVGWYGAWTNPNDGGNPMGAPGQSGNLNVLGPHAGGNGGDGYTWIDDSQNRLTQNGSGGGAAGPQGDGANGVAGQHTLNSPGTWYTDSHGGVNGNNAAANTGAGGSGGGVGRCVVGDELTASGGNGGSGYLYLFYNNG